MKFLRTPLSREVVAEMERLWCRTALPRAEIADRLNAGLSSDQIEWYARREGWTRDLLNKSLTHHAVVEERLSVASIARSRRIPNEPDRVRLVAPGTFPANGYRVGVARG